MSNMVTVKRGDFYYLIPMHEFSRYWLPHLDSHNKNSDDEIMVEQLSSEIPYMSKMAGLKRGKGYKRTKKAYAQKGSGKHVRNNRY